MLKKDDKEKQKQKEISKKRKKDKIFNSRYKAGEGYRDNVDYTQQTSIKVNDNYADQYLKDVYEYEESLDYNIGVSKIFEYIEADSDLRSLLHKLDSDTKIKISKEEINWCFNRILNKMDAADTGEQFYNPIYILEAISSILNINSSDPIKDYRKIFDSLDVEIQEELMIELNKKYGFLEGKMNKRKIH